MELNNDLLYPIGVQSFEKLRREGFVYVDKTGYIPMLLRNGYFFLSRPRRFGKSLFLSTLEAYFQGKKELFEGLEISKWEKDWLEYPVIHIDFSTCNETDISQFLSKLRVILLDIGDKYGLRQCLQEDIKEQPDDVSYVFERLIFRLHRKFGRNVAILIDEYDRGLLANAHDRALLNETTTALRPFFNVLKSSDKYIKFALLTGVSRFRNTTLFSGVNNLIDISLESQFASLLGITYDELEHYFSDAVKECAGEYGWTYEETLEELKNRYDGYRFTRSKEYVINPFSLLNALRAREFSNFWVHTGSSISLERYLKSSHFRIDELTSRWVSREDLEKTYSSEDPLSLLFQTGYLTIGDTKGHSRYRLTIPNQEVQSALVNIVIPQFAQHTTSLEVANLQQELEEALTDGNVDKMMELMRPLLAKVPYHEIDIDAQEKHLHLCFYVVFLMMGVDARCELASAAGRVDMVVQTPWKVYVLEFKMDKSPEEALEQIDDKGYAIPWESRGRDIYKVGVNFSSRLHTIDTWKTVVVDHR